MSFNNGTKEETTESMDVLFEAIAGLPRNNDDFNELINIEYEIQEIVNRHHCEFENDNQE